MIKDLKSYSEYKESGLPWLGKYPAHWVIKRGKSYLKTIDERSEAGKEELLTVSSARGVVPRNTAKVTMFKAASYAGHKLCWPGDLVINSLWAWAGGLGVTQHHGIISTAYSVYRSRTSAHFNPRFLNELVRSRPFHWELHVRSKGVWISRLQLTDTSFLDVPIPLPPEDEQAAIVRFLDHANQKVDGFIRAKRKLIALLNEQKQAIIQRAVSRGLDHDIDLKSSGIPWVGDIPKHWTISRVKNEFKCLNPRRIPLSSTQRGGMTERRYDYYGASGVIDQVEDFLFDDELLLIAEDGANLVLRNLPLAIIAKGKFWVNNHAHILKPKRGSLEYLAGYMETLNYQPWISGAAQPKLTKDRIMGITICVAPVSEQTAIVKYFTERTAPLRVAIARTEREITLMQEYRTRLTSDVVTGKLDVREAAAKLPDVSAPSLEADDGEEIDDMETEE